MESDKLQNAVMGNRLPMSSRFKVQFATNWYSLMLINLGNLGQLIPRRAFSCISNSTVLFCAGKSNPISNHTSARNHTRKHSPYHKSSDTVAPTKRNLRFVFMLMIFNRRRGWKKTVWHKLFYQRSRARNYSCKIRRYMLPVCHCMPVSLSFYPSNRCCFYAAYAEFINQIIIIRGCSVCFLCVWLFIKIQLITIEVQWSEREIMQRTCSNSKPCQRDTLTIVFSISLRFQAADVCFWSLPEVCQQLFFHSFNIKAIYPFHYRA